MPRAAHDVVDVAVDVHVDRVRATGRQRAADHDRGHEPDRRDGAGGKDHGRHGGDEQQLDDPRLRERHVGADACRSGRPARARRPASGGRHVRAGAWRAGATPIPPTARRRPRGAGTTKNADRRETTLSPPSATWTRTSTTSTVASSRGSGRIGLAADGERRPHHQADDDEAHEPMRQVDRLLRHDHGRQQRPVHEREVGVGEAGVVPGDPGAEEHLGEDRDAR